MFLIGQGGAAMIQASNFTCNFCTFIHNTAFNEGGGIHSSFATTKISNSAFSWNSAGPGVGGAVLVHVGLYFSFASSNFTYNTAESGGGLCIPPLSFCPFFSLLSFCTFCPLFLFSFLDVIKVVYGTSRIEGTNVIVSQP